jgi:hypothetical protein
MDLSQEGLCNEEQCVGEPNGSLAALVSTTRNRQFPHKAENYFSSYVSVKNGFNPGSNMFKFTLHLRHKVKYLIPHGAVENSVYSILFPRQPASLRDVLFETVFLPMKLLCDVRDACNISDFTETILLVGVKLRTEEIFANLKTILLYLDTFRNSA